MNGETIHAIMKDGRNSTFHADFFSECSLLGIYHDPDCKKWIVSHIPTGKMVCCFSSLSKAKLFVELVIDADWEFNRVTEDIYTRMKRRIEDLSEWISDFGDLIDA